MAGSQNQEDNPVAINVVPMVDVIFCLCVFFMCSFKFKQIEGKFDTWLPKDKGAEGMPVGSIIEEVRVALLWDEVKGEVNRKIGTRLMPDDDVLQGAIKSAKDDYQALKKTDPSFTIDADKRVPWHEVVTVMNLAKRVGIEKIEFAFGAPPPGTIPK
jgi:biopolymer transport protein ExbD